MAEPASNSQTVAAPSRPIKIAVVLAACAYVVGTGVYLSPPNPVRDAIGTQLVTVWHILGLGQGWSVFAPNLRRYNPHATATITFADGSTTLYEFPRMEKMSLAEKFRKEKWRKFDVDNMPWSTAAAYHEDVARYVAREVNKDPANPPLQVALTVHWAGVPELPTFVPSDEFPEHDKAASIFIYRVRKKDLRQ